MADADKIIEDAYYKYIMNPGPKTGASVPNVPNVTGVSNLVSNDKEECLATHEYEARLPKEWARAFAKLQFIDRPEQYRPEEWEQVLNDAGLFADKWASQAIKLGWSILDVFAIHKSGNRRRLDGEGAILSIRGSKVVAITADNVMIETTTGARQRICKPTADKNAIKTIVQT